MTLVVSAASLASCAVDGPGDSISCEGDRCDEAGTLDINSFLYRADDPLSHHYPTTYTRHPLPTVGAEGCRQAELRLFLINDSAQRYILQYEEHIPTEGSSSCNRYDVVVEEVVEGTWSVANNQLSLSGLGIANTLLVDGASALSLQLNSDLGSPGLSASPVLLEVVTSSWGLEECSGIYYDANTCPISI